jgi:hypothetical protein
MQNTFIKQCEIESSDIGIRLFSAGLAYTLFEVLNNTIEIGDPLKSDGRAGIYYNPLNPLVRPIADQPALFENNTILVNNATYGIFSRSSRAKLVFDPITLQSERKGGLNILDNEIYIVGDETFERSGVRFESGDRAFICGNNIEGSAHDNVGSIGFDFRYSPYLEVKNNVMDNTFKGMQYWGNCLADYRLKHNFYNNHEIGLSIGISETNPSGLIGRQLAYQQNRWFEEPLNSGYQAANYEVEISPNPDPHFFRVYLRPTYNPDPVRPNIWISGLDQNAPGFEYPCDGYPPHGFDGSEIELVRDEVEFSQYDVEQRWMGKFQIFMDLSVLDSAYRADSLVVLDSFYQAEKNGSIGLFVKFISDFNDALVITSLEMEEIDDLKEDILDLLEDMYGHYHNAISSTPDSADFAYNLSNLATLVTKRSDLYEVYSDIENLHQTELIGLRTPLSNLPDTFITEYNLKYTMGAILEYLISDNLDSILIEFDEIPDIADLCPLEGGLGVYLARSILQDNAIYDDETTCAAAFSRSNRNKEEAIEPMRVHFQAYPNPATDQITIEWRNIEFEQASIQLSDIKGNIVKQEKMNANSSGNLVWNIKSLKAGVYILTLNDEKTKESFIQKLEILK